MTSKLLISPADAAEYVAQLFHKDPICSLSINEEKAFVDQAFVSLGNIVLKADDNDIASCAKAIRYGAFEWHTPKVEDFTSELHVSLDINGLKEDRKKKAIDKVRRTVDSFGAIPIRLGLSHPVFDPHALEAMPFKKPTTVVADTSGVLQGSLSFVARYLHPTARIKVPAVVQMEIVNLADRFLVNRRATTVKRPDLLLDHTKSQAGQRVLLKLELHSDVELERTFLFGDPLRAAFEREADKELSDLNLNRSIRPYADRLILEAARQHQSQVSHGHRVVLLTSDQGLARMAMTEGLDPLFARSAQSSSLFGRCLTGANLHPFSGKLSVVSVMEVIWELATVFGCARLSTASGDDAITVHAIGQDLSWAPYHSRDDLLWIDVPGEFLNEGKTQKTTKTKPSPSTIAASDTDEHSTQPNSPRVPDGRGEAIESTAVTRKRKVALHKFSVDRMVALIDALDTSGGLTVDEIKRVLKVGSDGAMNDYRRFLETGGAVIVNDGFWKATSAVPPIAIALRNIDIGNLRASLTAFPAYAKLEATISEQTLGVPIETNQFGRAASTLVTLAEITEIGVAVHGQGFYSTPCKPNDEEFADIALVAFQKLDTGSGWISTGQWLEELIMSAGIHPCTARMRLQSASKRDLLKRVTEGSTTETEHDRHTLRVLGNEDGSPVVQVIRIYRGDFLIPGKASSSLKIEKTVA